jgi:hypothetical protein
MRTRCGSDRETWRPTVIRKIVIEGWHLTVARVTV